MVGFICQNNITYSTFFKGKDVVCLIIRNTENPFELVLSKQTYKTFIFPVKPFAILGHHFDKIRTGLYFFWNSRGIFFLVNLDMAHHRDVVFGYDFPQKDAPNSRFIPFLINSNRNFSMKIYCFGIVSTSNLFRIGKYFAFTFWTGHPPGHIIDSENNILARHNNGLAVCRRKNIVAGQHQHPCFYLSFHGKGYMNGHLVTIEVCIKCRTNQWMKLDGLSFNKNRLKSFNTQSV